MTFPTLMSIPEASKALHVSISTTWKLINASAITSIRIAGRVFIQDSAIAEYIQKNTRTAKHDAA